MSGLVSMALRMAVRYTLMNQTSAMARVFDSPLDAISLILDQADETERPLLAVYVQEASGDPQGRELTPREPRIELVVWSYITPSRTIVGDDISIEVRESGAALAMNLLDVQVRRALLYSTSPWRALFEEIVHGIDKVSTCPVLVEIEGGVKLPASETIIQCKTIPDPVLGAPLRGAWLMLDSLMRATAETAPLADVVKALIEGPTGLPSWRVIQGALALSDAEGRAIGVAPLDLEEIGEPAVLVDIDTPGGTDVTGPSTIPT